MSKRQAGVFILVVLIVISVVFGYIKRNNYEEQQVKIDKNMEIRKIEEELYVIRDNGRYGYINRAGLVIIKPQFEDAYNYSGELARVAFHHKYGFIDKTGRLVIPANYDDAGDFTEGLAMVGTDNKYGFIDHKGNIVIPLQYELVSAFSEGLAGVYVQGKWGFINKKGELVIRPRYDNAGAFRSGLAPVSEKELYGYINKNGTYEIKPQYSFAYSFSEGLAQIGINKKYGFINTKGKTVIAPQFDGLQDFSEGKAAVMIGDKWGFIDKKGRFAVKPIYENADSYSEGLGVVYDGKLWGYIDQNGSMVIKPQYDYAERFYKGLAAVRMDEVFSYIDKQGKLVWHETEDVAIEGPDGTLGRLIKMKIKSDQVDLIIKYPMVINMKNQALQLKINELLKVQSGIDYKGQQNETYRQDYDVMLNKSGIMSILNNSYMYMKGAAHGMSMRSAINIDMTDGKLYTLKDLFEPGADYKTKLNNIVKKQLVDDNTPLLREFEGINDKQEFYLTDKELVIYYQLYDYTPYAYGFLEFYIPYERITNIINKKGPIGKIMEAH